MFNEHTPREEYWYRFEDKLYAAPLDEFDNSVGEARVAVILYKLLVCKRTAKGVWCQKYYGVSEFRFVLRDSIKRFACPTIEEARISFIARKKKQIRIYSARVKIANKAIENVERNKYESYP